MRRSRAPDGFTLIELLLVIAVMAVLAGLVLPNSSPGVHDQLQSAAQIVAGDLAYARSLAVSYGDRCRVQFDPVRNRYVLELLAADGTPQPLPNPPFRNPGDRPDRYVVDFDELPTLGTRVAIEQVVWRAGVAGAPNEVEFKSLGQTTQSDYTLVWLAAGQDAAKRYILVYVNPVTGLATVGTYTGQAPAEWLQKNVNNREFFY